MAHDYDLFFDEESIPGGGGGGGFDIGLFRGHFFKSLSLTALKQTELNKKNWRNSSFEWS